MRQPLVNRKALGPGAVLGLGLMGFTAFAVYVPLYAPTLGMGGSKFVFLVYAVGRDDGAPRRRPPARPARRAAHRHDRHVEHRGRAWR